MSTPRLRVVRVPLNAEQREKIRKETGEDVTEALFAAPVPHDEYIENELFGEDAEKMADALWSGNAFFLRKVDDLPEAKKMLEQYIQHDLDPKYPALTILR